MTSVIERKPESRYDRRRARKRRRVVAVVVALLVAAGIAGGMSLVGPGDGDAGGPPVLGREGEGDQVTALFALTLHDSPRRFADSLTLFAIDRTSRNPVALFVPAGTLTQIPSLTFSQVGTALEVSPFLLRVSVENLLGVGVDRTVVLDDIAFGAVIDALGGIEIDVEEDVYEQDASGTRQLVFAHGLHEMSAADAVTYMTLRGDGTELDRFVRQQKVWQAIFDAGKDRIKAAIATLGSDVLTPDERAGFVELLTAFAAAPQQDRAFEVLPVDAVTTGGADEAYQVDDAGLNTLVRRELHRSALAPGLPASARPRVELRNGNGRPGSGQGAAALLIGAGMKIVVSGNAPSFDVETTRIVIYVDDESSRELGARIRDILGTGTVEVGTRGQGVVDVTVVLGKDMLES